MVLFGVFFGELSLGSPPHYAFRNETGKTMSNTAS
jgi:hypothetical protein